MLSLGFLWESEHHRDVNFPRLLQEAEPEEEGDSWPWQVKC